MSEGEEQRASGGCLCGAVRYSVRGPLRDVLICHCSMCQRLHTHLGAYSACSPSDLTVENKEALRWYRSSASARRGFCSECGANLFWEPAHGHHISVSAGSLDRPTGLRVQGHIHREEEADFCTDAGTLPA
ncbi:GFA family protein [Rubellimicrobium rubrum]|uniref:GFA family protein n=1 Tax=Rubellimicrobium rubrum TaxID=2585369 RepID=A0A5C4N393_9RHOB|nr:GFA family protein [Rubellimicrobium rubrum]TNC51465.1 GFA family protein [Rubellimicrobium rubrum]